MDRRPRGRRPEEHAGAARRLRFAAATIALALAACGAGGERGAEEPPAPAAEPSGSATHSASAGGAAAESSAARNGTAAAGAPAAAVALAGTRGEARGTQRPAGGNGSAGGPAGFSPGRTAMPFAAVAMPPAPPPPAPASAIPDAPMPRLPPAPPELEPEEAIARASDPPVGGEVRSLVTCGDVARAYGELMDGNRSCRSDEDCRVIEGSCEIGLGGCWYAVHRSVGFDDADRLAARYRDLACGGPACRCAAAPERAHCRKGVCAAAG